MGVCLIPLFFFLSSCSADWYLKKAIQKDPTLLLQDTTVVEVEKVQLDTVFESSTDTIEIASDIDSILYSLNLQEVCKDVIKPIVRYIDNFKWIDSTIVLQDTIQTEEVYLILQTLLETSDSGTIKLETSLTDLKVSVPQSTVELDTDSSFLKKQGEILLFILLILFGVISVLSLKQK